MSIHVAIHPSSSQDKPIYYLNHESARPLSSNQPSEISTGKNSCPIMGRALLQVTEVCWYSNTITVLFSNSCIIFLMFIKIICFNSY